MSLNRKFQVLVAIASIVANVYLLGPVTIQIFRHSGGSFGFGIILLPFLFVFHLLMIPGFLTLKNRDNYSTYLIANVSSIICVLAVYQLFIAN